MYMFFTLNPTSGANTVVVMPMISLTVEESRSYISFYNLFQLEC